MTAEWCIGDLQEVIDKRERGVQYSWNLHIKQQKSFL